jgi:hypothetical protein
MGQSVTGGAGGSPQGEGVVESLGKAKLVVEHVEVVRTRVPIEIPHVTVREETTTKYTVRTEDTIKYTPVEQPTTRYVPQNEETVRYTVREAETVRFIPRDVECERPIVTDKLYERPVIQEKVYQLISFTDLEAIKEAMALLPKLLEEIKELRKIRIVEEVIKVPKINYVPTDVYRITQSGELVKDASQG